MLGMLARRLRRLPNVRGSGNVGSPSLWAASRDQARRHVGAVAISLSRVLIKSGRLEPCIEGSFGKSFSAAGFGNWSCFNLIGGHLGDNLNQFFIVVVVNSGPDDL